jgi:hypothetical protein
VIFEDGSEATWAAARRLQARRAELDCPELRVESLHEYLREAQAVRMARAEKELLLDQATVLIDQFYAHLPFKQARYAVDPVREFRLLRAQIDHISDLAFHERLIRAFTGLRDAHTFYGLPAPFNTAFAFLPFRLGTYFDAHGRRRFVVTETLDGFDHPRFRAGAEIVLWRGMPVERAAAREADFEPGGNPASHFIRGMRRLTRRLLAYSVPPDEYYVTLEYHTDAAHPEHCAIVLPWCVATGAALGRKRAAGHPSVNEQMAEMARLSAVLWKKRPEARSQAPGGNVDERTIAQYPQVFGVRYSGTPGGEGLVDAEHPERRFGYIKILTFDLQIGGRDATTEFLAEFERILTALNEAAPDGLILDVRSNPGGSIGAAERILQMLTPWEIMPARFHFINSNLTQQIAFHVQQAQEHAALDANQLEWQPWVRHLAASAQAGMFVTAGEPLTSADAANNTGQRYMGPVTLVTDAMSYSATDLFAAGFQDHGIGPIIGVDESTGGGGANRWLHDELREKLEKSAPGLHLKPLPRGAQMGFAARRSSRVGPREGAVIEDEGVLPDIVYKTTRDDVMAGDHDLLRFACKQLSAIPTGQVRIMKADAAADAVSVAIESKGLSRIEFLLDGRLQCAFAPDGAQPFRVPTAGLNGAPSVVRVDGYALADGEGGAQMFKLVARAEADLAEGA